jgi:hypothetical protein
MAQLLDFSKKLDDRRGLIPPEPSPGIRFQSDLLPLLSSAENVFASPDGTDIRISEVRKRGHSNGEMYRAKNLR